MKCSGLGSLLAAILFMAILIPSPVSACATCFGQSDSALAQGMNMGILCLLGILAGVLSGVSGFFIYLARRSTRAPAGEAAMALREIPLDVQHD